MVFVFLHRWIFVGGGKSISSYEAKDSVQGALISFFNGRGSRKIERVSRKLLPSGHWMHFGRCHSFGKITKSFTDDGSFMRQKLTFKVAACGIEHRGNSKESPPKKIRINSLEPK